MSAAAQLLEVIQPDTGWIAVVGMAKDKKVKQLFVETIADVETIAAQLNANEYNVFFGVARYKDATKRDKNNVAALKALWVDLDCGADKPYTDQRAALTALKAFCADTGMPKPSLVNSGFGIHAYWALTAPVERERWEEANAGLKALCRAHALQCDPTTFEAARILRLPGTLNYKQVPARATTLLTLAEPVELGVLPLNAARKTAILGTPLSRHAQSDLAKVLQGGADKNFAKIMRRGIDGCRQLISCYQNRASLSEPRWFDAISIAKYCIDATTAAHRLSQGYPGYDPEQTERKMAHITGPHTCATFEANNPGGCAGCPHEGKIKSPIVLGIVPSASEPEAAQDSTVNDTDVKDRSVAIREYADPYFRGKHGGVFRKPHGDEEKPICVYDQDFYVTQRMVDPEYGDVVVMELHTPKDGVREFVVKYSAVVDKTELRKILASKGMATTDKGFANVFAYVVWCLNNIKYKQKAALMRLQFGWADRYSKFIIGDREITKDGVFYSPPSSATQDYAEHFHASGDYELWKQVFNMYGAPGHEPHAFAAFTAFGAPLFYLTGQRGAIINLVHPRSGTGKTTILKMCASVYGSPAHLISVYKDTANAKIQKLGVFNNLPYCIDEITNMSPAEFSDMIYAMSNGKGKDRMESGGNKLRRNATSWQTISLCSSNASFYEKMTKLKDSPDGETMRLLEYGIDPVHNHAVEDTKYMFDTQLMENYGHAGAIYTRYLVNNLEEVAERLKNVQQKFDREMRITQRERFWSAVVAANMTGAEIAKKLKIHDIDLKQVYLWAGQMVHGLRNETEPPLGNVASVIADYVNSHINNVVVCNDAVDRRGAVDISAAPIREPKGELLIRYEPDTKLLYITSGHFRRYCAERQISYKEVMKEAQNSGYFVEAKLKRIAKGLPIHVASTYCLVFDGSKDGFVDTPKLVAYNDGE